MRRLPPLASLRAFEAAARHMSFRRAAEELGVTPTAISHQIKLLEATLGVRLFERLPRRLVITAAGLALHPGLREGFEAFEKAVRTATAARGRRTVTLSATTAFTAMRLVPMVAAFRAMHPDIDLRLHACDAPADLRGGTADIAVRYGRGPYPGLHSEILAADRFAPVCSPRLGIRSAEDLARATLIHFEWRHVEPETPVWRRWLDHAAIGRTVDPDGGLVFSDEGHAIQAAVAGHGVALLSLVLVAGDLANGALVQPFGPVLGGYTYHLVHPVDPADGDAVAAVRDWLRTVVPDTPAPSPQALARKITPSAAAARAPE
ncbi:LysR substrate-binding domain-containing protein [Azospirillum halopraeferens]|uniref:LysR substrate-binding domain-containing protein n=1 Tax=Azospirillum halopraeferens TaxID=34010 RepID=UPI0004193C33|nr:LysR substrate-binding domain-containing protein [Azospirillum halopraeferens]